ncbi:hypothetical protein TREMEDRAFT_62038 [Tremella mesenterica DSM 1558]|uniref:uncharacterized protein n=1 Tax=Tremella mesenterica (strain ATCC 24925 / CBS 8224 / DSM 1558 / NBRC 9311 / NRRL Y-6157 / RJB 2259-6 / UBC 559-6) TaxID=578456 RepID=UPI0003F493D4|nr:uncharacterized protein TREMEDRAFT_62038 [Tremella mesenterica DSM 1558]EIW70277.1 hypothetical protein TREMEDRAFT_62038 [Tremella mesenterica DSM 1558]
MITDSIVQAAGDPIPPLMKQRNELISAMRQEGIWITCKNCRSRPSLPLRGMTGGDVYPGFEGLFLGPEGPQYPGSSEELFIPPLVAMTTVDSQPTHGLHGSKVSETSPTPSSCEFEVDNSVNENHFNSSSEDTEQNMAHTSDAFGDFTWFNAPVGSPLVHYRGGGVFAEPQSHDPMRSEAEYLSNRTCSDPLFSSK